MREQTGTPAYIAPEIILDEGYSGYGADVWSAGVVLYTMLYGVVPFRNQDQAELHKSIVTANYEIKESISVLANDLIKKILQPNPKKRLTIPEIFAHPWMQDIPISIQMFTDEEKTLIFKEFTFNDCR